MINQMLNDILFYIVFYQVIVIYRLNISKCNIGSF